MKHLQAKNRITPSRLEDGQIQAVGSRRLLGEGRHDEGYQSGDEQGAEGTVLVRM